MKIFCIGLSKTGNHSLVMALEILGYRTVHYPTTLEEIEHYDAASDMPVVANYKKLDKKYPKSKFILMTRDMNSWLKSFENHYRNFPPSTMPKHMVKMRKKFWGITNFDRNTMMKINKKHYKDVKKYFKGRENDLLIINIIGGDGWEKLCPFLNKKRPNLPFPKEGVGTYQNKKRGAHLLSTLYRKFIGLIYPS